ncbi:unnamed protein product [Pocillopora meandrina]|uniref:NB-ARC domain-containing protein n=1 Tax=Pocillopora meandrina TaxID=46732 RepID=A0AAU9WYS7_9CNID|nr:unnamed protein product [Pocillopora meandrina]
MLRKWKESRGSGASYQSLAEGLDNEVFKRHDLVERYCNDKVAEIAQDGIARLAIGLKDDTNLQEGFKNYLRRTKSVWLLIVDNLTVSDQMREFWPSPGQESSWGEGTVLVTTQDSELAPRSHAHARVISLDSGMEEEDAMELLRVISKMDVDEDAKKVASDLGYFPLSLACAAVYVRQMSMDRPVSKFSWKNYLSNLQEYFAYLDHSDFTHHNPCYPQSKIPAVEFAAIRMAENSEVLRAAFVSFRTAPYDPFRWTLCLITSCARLKPVVTSTSECLTTSS